LGKWLSRRLRLTHGQQQKYCPFPLPPPNLGETYPSFFLWRVRSISQSARERH